MVWYIIHDRGYAGVMFAGPSDPDTKRIIMTGGPMPGNNAAWDIEGDPIKGYFVKISDQPTAPGVGLLESEIFAFKDREMKWQIKAHLTKNGVIRYVIQGQGSEKVWVVPGDAGGQTASKVRYLDLINIGYKENDFPPEALWDLQRKP
ncbi:hypothetical protein GYMLUDRAFT_257781 [Collybiopsis luxurians FD-317 M1]|nr:hypothetical protein GYMLUDRAFT_257781 [Collybiopsis luxurians FD-317 M1]